MTASALTSMWAWDNPVPSSLDARGRGYAPAEPGPLVAFCVDRSVGRVFLSAPWAADEGPVGTWFGRACAALQAAGVQVSPLGGDPGWLGRPSLARAWALAALRSAPCSGIQLDVEPWATPQWATDRDRLCRQWLALLDLVRAGLPAGIALGVDAPWWLAHEPDPDDPDSTLLAAVLARVDRVGVVAFCDHAQGTDGIVALATPAVVATSAAGLPFTVGVETDTAEVAGGAQYTFADGGPVVLEAETALARDAFDRLPGYEGVTVEHHRSWRRLLGLD